MSKSQKHSFSTLCIEAGEEDKFPLGAVVKPIYQTSTFAFKDTAEVIKFQKGDEGKYLYTRYGNPTLKVVEDKMAALEGGEKGLVVSSGMAAVSTVMLTLLKAGDRIISTRPVYGGTYRLFLDLLPRLGIDVKFVAVDSLELAEKYIDKNTKLFFSETPTNPNLKIVDLEKVVKLAKKHRLLTVLDNTFATPYNQTPLSWGMDIVLHSGTKYLAGHSDMVCGVIVGRKKFIDQAREAMKVLGGCIDPFGAFLMLRGLKTLGLRMERHNRNARMIAQFLSKHPKVRRVFYPGLRNHPQYQLAKKQMRGFGGMVCFEVVGGLKAATKVMDNLKLFINATSLGGVESLASIPILTSHYGFKGKELKMADVTPGMIRLSCGIEDAQDLIDDLTGALNRLKGFTKFPLSCGEMRMHASQG
jgi:methionine-gamma-lyase